jgi:hypothetical protein
LIPSLALPRPCEQSGPEEGQFDALESFNLMMKTTFHIGMPKTGTTSIQNFLAGNRDTLGRNGVLYSRVMGEHTHNVLPVLVQGFIRGSQLQRRLNVRNTLDWAQLNQETRLAFAREIAEANPRHLILSSEHICSRSISEAHFDTLRSLIALALDRAEMTIVLYLRPQVEQAISLYSTMLRHGMAADVDSFLETRFDEFHYFDFQAMIARWSVAFPQARMEVRAFNLARRLPQGTVDDFVAVTGLEHVASQCPPPVRRNRSMGDWSAELLRQINLRSDTLPKSMAINVRRWLDRNLGGGAIAPDLTLARRFQAHFAASNAAVVASHFPDTPWVLEPDWDRLASPPRQIVTHAQVVALINHLFPDQPPASKGSVETPAAIAALLATLAGTTPPSPCV